MNLLYGLAATAAIMVAAPALGGATFEIVNIDGPGEGFNDPTPAVPVGGNAGTTIGQQRLIAFQHAAGIWAAKLDSRVTVRIRASFDELSCTATTAVLGSAGAIQVFRDFPRADFSATWYPVVLANKFEGVDLAEDDPNETGAADDIRARFNSRLGQPTCLAASGWYYGLDTNHGTQINLVTVLLHEFAHGLGFQSFTNVSNGQLLAGYADVYSRYYFDNTTDKPRLEMTDAERQASAINPRNVVWTGPAVSSNAPTVLQLGTPLLKVNTPSSVQGDYAVGAASFGPPLAAPGVTGNVVVAIDPENAGGPSSTDACSPLTNSAEVAGKIALVDRGTCGFVVKVKNAQDAGAIGVIVADNAAGGPPAGLGGADPTITIPSVRITLVDGNTIKVALTAGAVNATLGLDLNVRAGADRDGRVLLNTPNPVQPGSSVSHWDPITTPNQLMEPSINADLKLSVEAPQDLTRAQLRDIGWYPDADLDLVADDNGADQCLGSDLRDTVVIGGEDTGVSNVLFTSGCSITDLYGVCRSGAGNHGQYVSCAAGLGNTLRGLGFVEVNQQGRLQSAVGKNK